MSTGSTDNIPVRKLCSCNAVLCSPVEAKAAPDTELFGVLLLNSPSNTAADFAEYVRLFQLYRGGGDSSSGDAAPKNKRGEETSPYFICADGAYAALKRYCATLNAKKEPNDEGEQEDGDNDGEEGEESITAGPDSSALTAMRLCDVLIGDMDSLSSKQLRHLAAMAGAAEDIRASSQVIQASPPYLKNGTAATAELDVRAAEGDANPFYHKTVAAIPVALLEVIRRRREDAIRRRHNPAAAVPHVDTPVVLPIACQLSTDFTKGVALLERLRRLEEGNTDDLTEEEQAAYYRTHQQPCETAELTAACDAQLAQACEEAEKQAEGDAQEVARCRQLIMDVSPSTSTRLETLVMPNVVVFGALGGRMDHEIAAMCSVMSFARIFHLMAVNSSNVLFACWPDGVTQLLMPPSWTQQSDLSKDPTMWLTHPVKMEPYMCGIAQFGVLREMETTGCLYNIVKGRKGCYDGFTRTDGYRFAFDGLISACNTVTSRLVTIDLRPTTCDASKPAWDPDAPSVNPPTLFMLGRPKGQHPKTHA